MNPIPSPAAPQVPGNRNWVDADGTALTLRPVQPQDAALLGRLLEHGLSRESRYRRFHGALGRLSAVRLAQMSYADFDLHVSFVVSCEVDGVEQLLAEGRYHLTKHEGGAEFAIAVADAWQRRGIGRRLMDALVAAARERRVDRLRGEVLVDNPAMAGLMQACGFVVDVHPQDGGLLQATRLLPVAARPGTGGNGAAWLARWTQHLLDARLALGLARTVVR